MSTTRAMAVAAALATGVAAAGCASASAEMRGPWTKVVDKTMQDACTPDAAISFLKEGNKRFVAGRELRRDHVAQLAAAARGQYPLAAVVSCIDSRSTPEFLFDQGVGDIFVARVAGNYAPADIVGSLEFATKVAGARAIVVLGHTECGAIKGACDNVELGNLTAVIHALRPAVEDVREAGGERTSKNKAFVRAVTEANVRRTVASLREQSAVLRELEGAGKLKIVEAMEEISTGRVTFME